MPRLINRTAWKKVHSGLKMLLASGKLGQQLKSAGEKQRLLSFGKDEATDLRTVIIELTSLMPGPRLFRVSQRRPRLPIKTSPDCHHQQQLLVITIRGSSDEQHEGSTAGLAPPHQGQDLVLRTARDLRETLNVDPLIWVFPYGQLLNIP